MSIHAVARTALFLVFAVAALAKLRRPAQFRDSLRAMRLVPAALVAPVARLVIATEGAIAVSLVVPRTGRVGLVGAVAVLSVFTGTLVFVASRRRAACHCFGASRAPVGWWHVARGAALVALAALGAVAPAGGPGATIAGAGAGLACAALAIHLDTLTELFR
ncbi:MauE/DoxX family redox-associated membrane protein [Actinoplanes sp. NPDC048967]|uniref:MauE/DoxX family redox-associated membrane protein n=1 Tax=Actinoplanes sp. NPDC048967 TaxID=3155269 RepID=UPI0033D65E1E